MQLRWPRAFAAKSNSARGESARIILKAAPCKRDGSIRRTHGVPSIAKLPGPNWEYEVKFDGYRLLLEQVSF